MVLLVVNVLAFLAGIISIISTYGKTKKQIVICETVCSILRVILNSLAKSFSDAISKVIKIIAQITTIKDKYNKKLFIIISIIYTSLCLFIVYLTKDYRCLIAIIPANMEFYSLLKKEVKTYRTYIIISKILWTINNIFFKIYVAIIFDMLVILGHLFNGRKKV